MRFEWTIENERQLLELKTQALPFKEIATILGTTISSVKHKHQRLHQKANSVKHHHPAEKTNQVLKYVRNNGLSILETHAGWGNLSKLYRQFGSVVAHEVNKEKAKYLESLGDLQVIKGDSEKEVFKHIANNLSFDVIDIDGYGFPSRFFPHVFKLFKKEGVLFLTFPKMGVAQINKLMIRHYEVFWGINLSDKAVYTDKVVKKLKDYAFMEKKDIEVMDVLDLGKVLRLAIKVKHESMFKLVGLEINRNPMGWTNWNITYGTSRSIRKQGIYGWTPSSIK